MEKKIEVVAVYDDVTGQRHKRCSGTLSWIELGRLLAQLRGLRDDADQDGFTWWWDHELDWYEDRGNLSIQGATLGDVVFHAESQESCARELAASRLLIRLSVPEEMEAFVKRLLERMGIWHWTDGRRAMYSTSDEYDEDCLSNLDRDY